MKIKKKRICISVFCFIIIVLIAFGTNKKLWFDLIYDKYIPSKVEVNFAKIYEDDFYVEGDSIIAYIRYNEKKVKDSITGDFKAEYIEADGFDYDVEIKKKNKYNYEVHINNIRKNGNIQQHKKVLRNNENNNINAYVCPLYFHIYNIGEPDTITINTSVKFVDRIASIKLSADNVVEGKDMYYDIVYRGNFHNNQVLFRKEDMRLAGHTAEKELYYIDDKTIRVYLWNIKLKVHRTGIDSDLLENECKVYITGGTAVGDEGELVNAMTKTFFISTAQEYFYNKVNSSMFLVILLFITQLIVLIELIFKIYNKVKERIFK